MPIAVFALASLTPALLLALGALFGGGWLLAALIHVTLFAFLMDRLVAIVPSEGAEFPAGDGLLVALGLSQLALLPLGVWALTTQLSGTQWLAGFAAFGLWLGQIGNSAAHELIHRRSRALYQLGRWMFTAILFGHHTSSHRLVHHPHVASPADPNSPRRGQSYYGFLPRAWIGSFRAGLAAERALLARQAQGRRRLNPYVVHVGGALAFMALAFATLGWKGLAVYLALAFHAQSQILMSDYVQHYGLRRQRRADGRLEPVSAAHSWNGGQWFSAAMMLNAPRHSDHHAHPARPYPQLRLPEGAPMLPAPLPAMALVALVPPLWRRVMDPRVDEVQAGVQADVRAGIAAHGSIDSA
ncbi:alkane 1-monooxygenase [Pararhodobacter sp.]|uniref:alkane 1-monooxygenase n=1 Tax=Pararhodobacter sp. TaxID=2127056 RepID=UPI002FDC89F7